MQSMLFAKLLDITLFPNIGHNIYLSAHQHLKLKNFYWIKRMFSDRLV